MSALVFKQQRLTTPLGEMLIVSDEQQHLRALDWQDYESRMHRLLLRQYQQAPRLLESKQATAASDAMQAYFDGQLDAIDTLPVAFGGTPFQRQVWNALRSIPCGSTWSYRQLAQHLQRPAAVRAVGLANGSNPIGIVVPCHRVIGADRSLTGYGGGLHRKEWLLRHEGALPAQLF